MGTVTPLCDLVPGWADTDPVDGDKLAEANPDDLSDVARAIRKHVLMAKARSRMPALLDANVVFEILKQGNLLHPIENCWTLYMLGKDKCTVRRPREDGGTQNVLYVKGIVPDPEELPELPRGGSWLVIWHGSVDVLSKKGVPFRLSKLRACTQVSDVVFYSAEGDPPTHTMFSLINQIGSHEGEPVDFPDREALNLALTPKERA